MSPDRRRAPRMAPDERRAAIVAAAGPLFRRHGAAVTTRQIAEAADIAEGTIFRVFPDKESVIQAVVAEAFDQSPTLRELAAINRALPFRDRLTAAVTVLQKRVSDVFGLLGALGWMRGAPPERKPPNGYRHRQPDYDDEAERDFRDAVVGVVGPDECRLRVPAAELAHVMKMLVFSATHPLICAGRPMSAEQIVTLLLDGLLDESAPAAPTTTEDP
ncbi:TetR/AcrR family transcriptional regulator [Pseudonocardia aurantiaca]|uniref:TetR/AcrR family transcriptional regulator n=1 Tax=Pseudonocardia aurantiaca TaxID=75290 RepID=A0ABW4FXW8_9PSEU